MWFSVNAFYGFGYLLLALVLFVLIHFNLNNPLIVWWGSVGLFFFSFLSGVSIHAWRQEKATATREVGLPAQLEDR